MRFRSILAALVACASLALLACEAPAAAAATPDLSHFLDQARGLEDWLIDTRRLFHGFPELVRTAAEAAGSRDRPANAPASAWPSRDAAPPSPPPARRAAV